MVETCHRINSLVRKSNYKHRQTLFLLLSSYIASLASSAMSRFSGPRSKRLIVSLADAYSSQFRLIRFDPHLRCLPRAQSQHQQILRCASTLDENISGDQNRRVRKIKASKKQKIKVRDEIQPDQAAKLAAAFDSIARSEGFDPSTARFAQHSSFEAPTEIEETQSVGEPLTRPPTTSNQIQYDASAVERVISMDAANGNEDMDSRIAVAKQEEQINQLPVRAKFERLSRPTYRDDDESTHNRMFLKIVKDPLSCSACGSDFQAHNESQPGYLPPDKFSVQVKLSKVEQLKKLQAKAEVAEWTAEDEVEWLIQSSDDPTPVPAPASTVDIEAVLAEMDLELRDLYRKPPICKRCHHLQNFGKVEEPLRPGWTDEPLLSQQAFRDLLAPIRLKPAVIVALVDIFDFSGSILPELDNIVGDNPVIIAANKVDLLSPKLGQQRIESWVRRELEFFGIRSLANIGGAVRLISCKNGFGISDLLAKARILADKRDCDVYVLGAANSGKSSFVNYILSRRNREQEDIFLEKDFREERSIIKRRAGNMNSKKDALTTSSLPGTTLKFIRVDLGNGRNLFDTPGLLVNGTLTQLLTPDELKMVVPKK
jgi:hypothetical protein